MKKNILAGLSLISLFLILSSFISHNVLQNWVELGTRKVNFGLDKDVIDVNYEGTFTAIKLEVTDGALNMHRCVVHFENGTQQEVELRYNFAKGSESRVIDLNGNKRFIKKIVFWYDSKNLQINRATLTVWGKK